MTQSENLGTETQKDSTLDSARLEDLLGRLSIKLEEALLAMDEAERIMQEIQKEHCDTSPTLMDKIRSWCWWI